MVEAPGVAIAFLAGVLSFLSPCCLPLVPGYLATIGGAPGSAPAAGRRRLLGRALAFIATFSLVFIVLGMTATAAGALLGANRDLLNAVAGVTMILFGAMLIASLYLTALNRQWRVPGLLERASHGGPMLAGAAFALAWTPCIGPTLGAILGLAATGNGVAQGGALLTVYALGLGLPFLLSALAFERTSNALGFFRRHHVAVNVTGGLIIAGMGVLVLSGELFQLNVEAQRLLSSLGLDFFYNL